jgi:hypothetical protein
VGEVNVPAGRQWARAAARCAAAWAVKDGRSSARRRTMADESKPAGDQQIQIQIDPHHQGTGVYSNLMMISHRKEEFILDFLFLQPQRAAQGQAVATLRSRIITSPEHAKRILRALQENIRRYEDSFGIIDEATDMPKVMH